MRAIARNAKTGTATPRSSMGVALIAHDYSMSAYTTLPLCSQYVHTYPPYTPLSYYLIDLLSLLAYTVYLGDDE